MSRSQWIALVAVLVAGVLLWIVVALAFTSTSVEWGSVGEWVGGLGAVAVAMVLGALALGATRRTNALMEAGLPAEFSVEYVDGILSLSLVEGRAVVVEGLSKERVIYRAKVEGEGDTLRPHGDFGEEALSSLSGDLPQTLHRGESLAFMPSDVSRAWAMVEQKLIPFLTARVHYRVVEGSPIRTVEVAAENPDAPEMKMRVF